MHKKKIRINFDISYELHRSLKYRAIDTNSTITEYVIQAIVEKLASDQFFNSEGVRDESTDIGDNGAVDGKIPRKAGDKGDRDQ